MTVFNELTPELIEQLTQIVGEQNAYVGEDISVDYACDEMTIYGTRMPEIVLLPETTEQVSAIMKLANDNTVPVTVRGAGTGLVGGCTPLEGGIVLSVMNMNKILHFDYNNFYVKLQPGVRLLEIAEECEKRGFLYPPDPGEKLGSVGGNVSTNAGGMRAVKYGTTRDYVLAMTVVLPNGEIMELGNPITKTSSGYSLLHLMIGSEGTLGVITELTMKIIPLPKEDLSFILPFKDVATAIGSVPAIRRAGIDPRAIEFMERDIVDAAEAYNGTRSVPTTVNGQEVGGYILITLDGTDEDEIFTRAEILAEVAEENGAFETLVLRDSAEKTKVWAARGAFLHAIESETEFLDENDVVVPTDRIAEFLQFAHDVGEENGLRIRSFGHAGDGNLHIYTCANGISHEEFMRRSDKVMVACYAKCEELQGAVSGEHGIGHAKREYLRTTIGDLQYDLMGNIKLVFDPKGILNPGKVCG